jgi:UDP-N-acetylmuramoyl-L-alanyl-D-glutamate--2,6-diaminopimelate ligase
MALAGGGVNLEGVVCGISRALPRWGRLERVGVDAPFRVFVDYAHTPDALENVLATLREICVGKLIVVFGCGGDRDRAKRPLMGAVASRLADCVVVTSDNPRSENPADIIREICAGVTRDVSVEEDRRVAIRKALSLATAGDVVLIAGKGHERGQIFATHVAPFDDSEFVRAEWKLTKT